MDLNNKINNHDCITREVKYKDMNILFQPKTMHIFKNT